MKDRSVWWSGTNFFPHLPSMGTIELFSLTLAWGVEERSGRRAFTVSTCLTDLFRFSWYTRYNTSVLGVHPDEIVLKNFFPQEALPSLKLGSDYKTFISRPILKSCCRTLKEKPARTVHDLIIIVQFCFGRSVCF